MRIADLLRRFGRRGVPGAARRAGVPPDARHEREAELEPVFAALEECVRQSEAIRRLASSDAARLVDGARAAAQALIEDADRRRAQVAADETAGRLREVDEDNEQLLARARREAEHVRSISATRIPALAERVARLAESSVSAGAAR